MISALWTGISGLATQQKALDNESHNIANVNTVGYKATRISFADQLYQDKIGKGSKVLDAEKLFTQGGRKQTGVAYDLALNGEGFFAVTNKSAAGTSETYYTRAGNFRMGDNGTLQDAQGNEVQGWAMSDIDPQKNVLSTNPDTSVFTDSYSELLSSKIVKHSNYIETITAKATDYNDTAVKDAELIYDGAGAKSKAAKVSDVEELVKSYTSWLEKLQADPDGLSATSTKQVSQLNFKGDTLKKEGDQLYVFINGDKISQNFVDTVADPSLTPASVGDLTGDGNIDSNDADLAASRIATYKALANKISEQPGFRATTITNGTAFTSASPYANLFSAGDTFENSTKDLDVLHGMIQITGLVPGEEFTVKEHAEVSGTQVTQGSINSSGSQSAAVAGTGLGAIESVKQALSDAIVGKQRDVYRPSDLNIAFNATNGTLTSNAVFDYEISIYDKDLEKSITITAATTPLSTITADGTNTLTSSLEDLAAKINVDINLKEYVKAEVINGNLVVKTLDKNSDVEFSGTLKGNTLSDQIATAYSSTTAAAVGVPEVGTFGLDTSTLTAGNTYAVSVTVNGTTQVATYTQVANGDDSELEAALAGLSNIATAAESADVYTLTAANNNEIINSVVIAEVTSGSILDKNADYSGREGAGAEFMEIVSTINQTTTQDSLQLRLDTLSISDSAFGEFSVDDTGLVTMKQDGAEYAIGQISVAKFNNMRGLEAIGDNLYAKTNTSGEAIFNTNNNKTALIESQSLELSTADLSESLVNLMVFQRAFEANAKSITTADQLLTTLIQLKR